MKKMKKMKKLDPLPYWLSKSKIGSVYSISGLKSSQQQAKIKMLSGK